MKKILSILIFLSLTIVGFGQIQAPNGIRIGKGGTAKTLSVATLGYLDATSSIQGQLNNIKGAVISAQDYGATGDGTADDVTHLQTALDAIAITGGTLSLNNKTYLFTTTLYVYGNVNIIDGTLKPRMASDSWCSIALGAKKNTVSGNYLWSGRIDNVTFDCAGTVYNGNIINLFRGKNYAIKNCRFIEPHNTSIKGTNNGAYASDNLVREEGLYENNYIEVLTTVNPVGEGMSIDAVESVYHSYATKDVRFINNVILSNLDDPIAIHGECSNVIISGNICKSRQGRITVHDSKDVLVSDNILQHTTDAGWFIDVDYEIAGSNQPENITIVNNKVTTPSTGGANGGYLIRAKGVKNLIVDNNELINNLPDNRLVTAIEIVDGASGNSIEPKITNNKIRNGIIMLNSVTDLHPVCTGNIIDSGYVYIRNLGGAIKNNLITPHPGYDYIYYETIGDIIETKLAEFYVILPSATSFTMTLLGGMTSFKIPKNFQITRVVQSLSASFSAGWVDLLLNINGSQKDQNYGPGYNEALNRVLIPNQGSILVKKDQVLTVEGSTANATNTNGKIMTVEIYGAYAK